ncbi:hypothetical protein OMA36_003096 [Vibrio fluvialis]|nr:hypothetical protein [Vibrio fluvialis]
MEPKIPFDLLIKNRISREWDDHVIKKLETTEEFDAIIDSHDLLSKMAKPMARKEIAKVIFSTGKEPNLLAQKFAIKEILGSVGEALTELLLPGDDVEVNNKGYDVNYCGNYIEVKSTITEKAKMSSVQYETADYLIVHKYEKNSGKYNVSLLVPLKVLHEFKPNRSNTVSVSTKTDEWSRSLYITLNRIHDFFQIENNVNNHETCNKCHGYIENNGVVSFRALVEPCYECKFKYWELRYLYYINKYHNKNVTIKNNYLIDMKSKFIVNNENKLCNSELRVRIFSRDGRLGVHFCPSLYLVRSCYYLGDFNCCDEFINFITKKVRHHKKIREFLIYTQDGFVHFMVRSNLAPIFPGFIEEKYLIGDEPIEIRDFMKELGIKNDGEF